MRQKTSLLLVVCLLSFSVACSRGLQRKLVGRWGASKNATNTWDFKADGTTQVVEQAAGGAGRTVATGTYKVENSETIVLHWTNDSPSKQLRVKVLINDTGDTLLMTLPDTSPKLYVRVN